jgi:hypothetical protein
MMPMDIQPEFHTILGGFAILANKTRFKRIIKEVDIILLIHAKQVAHNIFGIGHQIHNKIINRLIIVLNTLHNQMTQILIIVYE